MRSFQTSTVSRDIDSAAKFIGAGAATVGVAGSGVYAKKFNFQLSQLSKAVTLHVKFNIVDCKI